MSETNKLIPAPMNLISAALGKGMEIKDMKDLFDLQERWEKNEASKAFKKAFSEFQKNKPIIVKTKKGHNCKYAPLSKIQQLVDPILSIYGLSYRFKRQNLNNEIEITCIISHVKGHSEESSLNASIDLSGSKNPIQGIGSTISYLMRYTLSLALGISSDDDNDGNKTPTKQELNNNHDKWEKALESVKTGTGTIEQIKKKIFAHLF
jgi:hypothetical protein